MSSLYLTQGISHRCAWQEIVIKILLKTGRARISYQVLKMFL